MTDEKFTRRMRYAAMTAAAFSFFWWLFVIVMYYVYHILPQSGFTTAMLAGFIYGLAFPPFYNRSEKEAKVLDRDDDGK